jgi:hypothetical protein
MRAPIRHGFSWLVVALCAIASPATAATIQENFASGVAAFRAGRYDEAARTFGELRDSYGVRSPDLWVDLAAAEYEAGHPGKALLELHRAGRSAPGTHAAEVAAVGIDRIRAALNQREGKASGRSTFVFGNPGDTWAALFGWADARVAGMAFLAAWALAFLALAGWRLSRRPGVRRVIGACAVALAAAVVVSGTVAYGSDRAASGRVGVVLADGTALYDGVGQVEKAMTLPEGLEVMVLDVRGGFVRVRLSSGRQGWSPEASIGVP